MCTKQEFALAVSWKDEFQQGLQGVVKVHKSDLEVIRQRRQRQSDSVDVGDLTVVLNNKLGAIVQKEGGVRLVESVSLYGTKLDNNRLVESIVPSVSDGCPRLIVNTQFAFKEKGGLLLVIKSGSGETTVVWCDPSDSINWLKLKFEDKWGHPSDQQRLIYKGEQLDDYRKISDYKITSESVLNFQRRLRGGGGPATPRKVFADVTDNSNLHEHNLSGGAPDWRVCDEGLNIEGECMNR
ncbi:hypothetical protein F442_11547 [Phytophthora nicotianae P10297]|uniref:Ubiquitin-like domain-containing protein n=3 Tax=Phytophthora nicotianae TaxID=4792 RepID=V9EVU2_PHYNI|nr:hypothetical protein F443_11655 [Phytophthora nicotianae P1569]ETP41254.1 hypothetical protein F442_11547 [Phytophthora nicotianae P10297]